MLYESLDEMQNEFIMSPFYPRFLSEEQKREVRAMEIFPLISAAHSIFQSAALVRAVTPDGLIKLCDHGGDDILHMKVRDGKFLVTTMFDLPKRNQPTVVCDISGVTGAVKKIGQYAEVIIEKTADRRESRRHIWRDQVLARLKRSAGKTYSRWDAPFDNADVTLAAIEEFTKPGGTLPLLKPPFSVSVQSVLNVLSGMRESRLERIAAAEVLLGTPRWHVELSPSGVGVVQWTMEPLLEHIRQYPHYFTEQISSTSQMGEFYSEPVPPRLFPTLRDVPTDMLNSIRASMTLVDEIEQAPTRFVTPSGTPAAIAKLDPDQFLTYTEVTHTKSGRLGSGGYNTPLYCDIPAL